MTAMLFIAVAGIGGVLIGVVLGARLVWAASGHEKPFKLTERKPKPIGQDDTK